MGAGGAQHEVDLLAHGAGSEQEDHDEGVREAHLGAVDGAVARALDDGQQVAVRRVEENGLDRRPDGIQGGLLCVVAGARARQSKSPVKVMYMYAWRRAREGEKERAVHDMVGECAGMRRG